MLSLGDFAALDAAGADANALRSAIYKGFNRLEVDVPAAPRDVVRVGDVVSKTRAFAANVAYLCHNFAPNLGVSCRPEEATRRVRRQELMCLSRASQLGEPSGRVSQRGICRHTPPTACRTSSIPGTGLRAKGRRVRVVVQFPDRLSLGDHFP